MGWYHRALELCGIRPRQEGDDMATMDTMWDAVPQAAWAHQQYSQGITVTRDALEQVQFRPGYMYATGGVSQQRLQQAYEQMTQSSTTTGDVWYQYTDTTAGPVLQGATFEGACYDEYVEPTVETPRPVTSFSRWLEEKYGRV